MHHCTSGQARLILTGVMLTNTMFRDIPIDWDALESAFENNAPAVHSFLHLITGDVLRLVDGVAEPEMYARARTDPNLIRVTPVSSHEQHTWLERFVETVKDDDLRERLALAIVGKGSFQRFKNAIGEHIGERRRYVSFRRERIRIAMDAWLASLSLNPVERTSDGSHPSVCAAAFLLSLSASDLSAALAIVSAHRCLGCGVAKPCGCLPKRNTPARTDAVARTRTTTGADSP
jgi:hypothetical protein